jgi:putative Mn2+ efflux pump MntP
METMDKIMRKRLAYVLVVIGFILIVLNAAEYIGRFFGLSIEIRTSMIIGIVLVILGMFVAKETNT